VAKKTKSLVTIEQIDGMIRTVRSIRVILDSDLAKVYGVPTFRFNEAIKRNRHRFPPDFMFQLTREEFGSLRSQIAMSKRENSSQIAMSKTGRGGRRTLPYAFTEHGALQAANVLRSPRAVQMSVFVIRAFVKMRETLRAAPELARKLAALEKKHRSIGRARAGYCASSARSNADPEPATDTNSAASTNRIQTLISFFPSLSQSTLSSQQSITHLRKSHFSSEKV
jgi:hypothetical protein